MLVTTVIFIFSFSEKKKKPYRWVLLYPFLDGKIEAQSY